MCNIVLWLKTSLFVCPFKNLLSEKTALSLSLHWSMWTLGFWAVPAGFMYEELWLYVSILLWRPHPVGTKFSWSLDTGDQVLAVSVRWRVRHELSPSAFSGLVVSPQVCPHCLFLVWRVLSGLDEWKLVWSGLPAWAESPGAHLSTTPPQGCCVVWEQSMCSCP